MNIHNVKETDADYPLCMLLVDNKEKYDLISMDGLMLVPLVQVIDLIASIKPDIVLRHGKKYCPNCGTKMVEPQERQKNENT